MKPNERAERVSARISGWPRPLRITFTVWALVASLGFFFSLPLAIMFALFDAPSVLSAGPIPAMVDRHLILVCLIFGLPFGLLLLLAEKRSDRGTWREKLQRGFLATAPAVFILVFGLLSASTILDGLAVATNAVSKPSPKSWSLEISGTKLHAGDRGCRKDLYFEDPIAPEHRSKLCVYSLDPLFQARAGDILHLTGRPGPFGITYRRDDRVLERASEVTR
ncbi:hypothetical protein [Defluviimonas sp. SAOS-178_SWC]|uniref:hypothetical protein n=1 Tax=Defluviimonas sp. SAOS-178_SWC TaxID=3121287 RepID=UPI003221F538